MALNTQQLSVDRLAGALQRMCTAALTLLPPSDDRLSCCCRVVWQLQRCMALNAQQLSADRLAGALQCLGAQGCADATVLQVRLSSICMLTRHM